MPPPAYRVLFMPWELEGSSRDPGAEYVDKNASWTAHRKAKQIADTITVQVWYRANGAPSPLMGSLGASDHVYIRGHSLAETSCIFSKGEDLRLNATADPEVRQVLLDQGRDTGKTVGALCLYASDVAARLIATGLRPSFAGAIKCYNCHSSEQPGGFAQALADELYARGFHSCTFYGYRGALSSFPEPQLGYKTSTAGGHASANRDRMTPRGQAASS